MVNLNHSGKGGFGTVYLGQLKNGNQAAVKLLSASSSQAYKEFQNEAELLMRVHHRNLASFVGYSHDDDKMALVYEYMANGNLKDYILGLEYLHHGCRPDMIPRDVKSANILLCEKLDAKIADFGLSKGLPDDQTTTDFISTTVYLDPGNYPSLMATWKVAPALAIGTSISDLPGIR